MAEKEKQNAAQGSGINVAGGSDPADINTIIVAEEDVNSKNQGGNSKNISSDYGGSSATSDSEDDDGDAQAEVSPEAYKLRVTHMGAAIEAGHLVGGIPQFKLLDKKMCMKLLQKSLVTQPLGAFNIKFNHLVGEDVAKHSNDNHSHEFYYNTLLATLHFRNHLVARGSPITLCDKSGTIKPRYLCNLGAAVYITGNINIPRDNLINAGSNAPVIQSVFFNYDTIGSYLNNQSKSPVNFTMLQSVLKLMKAHAINPLDPLGPLVKKRVIDNIDSGEPPKKKQRVLNKDKNNEKIKKLNSKSKSKHKKIVADSPVFHARHKNNSPQVVLNADGTLKSGLDIFNVDINGGAHCNSNSNVVITDDPSGKGNKLKAKSKSKKKKPLPRIPSKNINKSKHTSKSKDKTDLLDRVTNKSKSKKGKKKVTIGKKPKDSHTLGSSSEPASGVGLCNYGLFGGAASAIGGSGSGDSSSNSSDPGGDSISGSIDDRDNKDSATVAALKKQIAQQQKLLDQQDRGGNSKRKRASARGKKKSGSSSKRGKKSGKNKKSRKRDADSDRLAVDMDRDSSNGGGKYSSRQRVCSVFVIVVF